MEVLDKKSLVGTWGTLLLPIEKNDTINYSILAEEIDYLIEAQLEGIYSNGTAGEFHNQNEKEFDRINEILAEKCNQASCPFQIGVSHMSPLISKERLLRSIFLKPSAFQVILPDWVSPNPKEQIDFLREMAEMAGEIPLVLYNPPHSKLKLDANDFERLVQEVPHLIGTKVADGDQEWYEAMRNVSLKLSVFVPGHHLASGIISGVAKGAYSNVACLSPQGAKKWYQLMETDMEEALKIEKSINLFFEKNLLPFKSMGYSNSALDKLLAAVGGWAPIGLRLRWPYQSIPESEIPELKKQARQILPSFFF